MRLKVSIWKKHNPKKLVTCVSWNSAEEFYSCGEDHLLIKWRLEGGMTESTVLTEFPGDFYPTDMEWNPRSAQGTSLSLSKQSSDVLLITTADGKFHLVSKNGRIEKTVEAHKGATLTGRWNHDGSALMTGGEDGLVKIWSRNGMLRLTLVRGTAAILSATWSPDNSGVLYTQGSQLALQSLNSSIKSIKWYAHEGLILGISWNKLNNLIVSGGEDCRYRVWDSKGIQLFSSAISDYPITAICWAPNGQYFATGSYNTIKLCDKTGWSYALEKVQTGSVYSIAWSNDSTQVAMACGQAAILTGHVVDRRLEWNNYELTLTRRKTILVKEVGAEFVETLEISDRVVNFEFAFDHLVVITPTQCHIYSVTNWNTPAIFDLKSSAISAVILAEKHFLLVEWNALSLYSYQGRLINIPKWKGMTQDPLFTAAIALSSDTLVLRDQTNEKLLHVLEISNNKPINEVQAHTHLEKIQEVAMNFIGGPADRQLALIDVNRDLYLISIRNSFGRVCKIASMAQNVRWATDANILAAMLDAILSVWLCPNCVHYSDRKIIRKTRIDKENSEFGKQPSIFNIQNGIVTVRRGDGALVALSLYTFFTTLHQYTVSDQWQDALALCRVTQNDILWTCLAVMATESKQLETAEEAYAAIERYDKVDYIQYIQTISNKSEKLAEMALLSGDVLSAEGILLQNGLVSQAIKINLQMYLWNRALELAIRHKKMVKDVLEERQKYLQLLKKKETNSSFLSLNATHFKPPNNDDINKKIDDEDEVFEERIED